jgi:glycosyltransferase involved in cell wall biosynthesis
MAASPTVTVLVPTIGRAAYLPSLIAAAEAQTFRDVEFLVLDNASPAEVVAAHLTPWAERDSRVKVLRCEPRVPMFANFNRGVQAASGSLIAFFHDDDVYRPRFLERLVKAFEHRPRVGFAGSNYDFADETGQVTEERRWFRGDRAMPGLEYIEDVASRGRNIVPMPGLMFRREALGPGFDLSLPIHFGDFVFLMRIAEQWDVGLVEEPIMAVRRHAEQASQSMPLSKSIPLRTQVLEDYLKDYRSRKPEQARFVRTLSRRVRLGHGTGLLWGWLTAAEPSEADACAVALGAGSAVVAALEAIDRAGLRTPRGIGTVRRLLKQVAPLLRL